MKPVKMMIYLNARTSEGGKWQFKALLEAKSPLVDDTIIIESEIN
jgi:hypothetical protein